MLHHAPRRRRFAQHDQSGPDVAVPEPRLCCSAAVEPRSWSISPITLTHTAATPSPACYAHTAARKRGDYGRDYNSRTRSDTSRRPPDVYQRSTRTSNRSATTKISNTYRSVCPAQRRVGYAPAPRLPTRVGLTMQNAKTIVAIAGRPLPVQLARSRITRRLATDGASPQSAATGRPTTRITRDTVLGWLR